MHWEKYCTTPTQKFEELETIWLSLLVKFFNAK